MDLEEKREYVTQTFGLTAFSGHNQSRSLTNRCSDLCRFQIYWYLAKHTAMKSNIFAPPPYQKNKCCWTTAYTKQQFFINDITDLQMKTDKSFRNNTLQILWRVKKLLLFFISILFSIFFFLACCFIRTCVIKKKANNIFYIHMSIAHFEVFCIWLEFI